jgi:inorganic pyrophosphatase
MTQKMNPWHDVSYGDNAPEIVTRNYWNSKEYESKYELDKETGMLILDRVIYSSCTILQIMVLYHKRIVMIMTH